MINVCRTVMFYYILIRILIPATDGFAQDISIHKSIQDFGVLPDNNPAENTKHLQEAIIWSSPRGAALFVEPSDQPYRLDGGIVLLQNVSLIGVHGPVGRGTRHPQKAQPVGSVFQADFDVLDFGAVGDGKTDNTMAFQMALNKAAEQGGVVHVPAGKFRFDGEIIIPRSVGLQGIAIGLNSVYYDKGSILMPYAGRDDENAAPFITMESSSTLRGLGIVYPEQQPEDIRPYPYCIQTTGRMANVIDITIANAYNGIDCGSVYNEAHNLRNIQLCALRRGIYVDRTTDIGRIENVHMHSVAWWDLHYPERMNEKVKLINDFTLANLEGFIIGRCDWEYMVNCFVIWAKVGFRFIETTGDPVGNDPQANILITQSGSDVGPLAVLVEKVQYHAGIAFANCQFMDGILIEEENQGPVKLTNCGFWGWAETLGGTHLINKGKGTVYLTACNFNAKNWIECHWEPKIPFIKIMEGTLQMMNCRFQDNGNTPDAHIYLGEKVRSAVIMGNSVEGGKLRVANKSGGDVQILGNVEE